jgi:hypothetical protein
MLAWRSSNACPCNGPGFPVEVPLSQEESPGSLEPRKLLCPGAKRAWRKENGTDSASKLRLCLFPCPHGHASAHSGGLSQHTKRLCDHSYEYDPKSAKKYRSILLSVGRGSRPRGSQPHWRSPQCHSAPGHKLITPIIVHVQQ